MKTATPQVGRPQRRDDGWFVPSSRGDQQYLVQRHRFGWSCQCPAFAYRGQRTGTCKHIGRVIAMLHTDEED
jgi:hypothetical protein